MSSAFLLSKKMPASRNIGLNERLFVTSVTNVGILKILYGIVKTRSVEKVWLLTIASV